MGPRWELPRKICPQTSLLSSDRLPAAFEFSDIQLLNAVSLSMFMSVFKTPLSIRIQATLGSCSHFSWLHLPRSYFQIRSHFEAVEVRQTITTGVEQNKHLGLGPLEDLWISISFSWDGGSCCLGSLSAIACWSGGASLEWLGRGPRAPPLNHTLNRTCSSQTVSIPEGQGTLKGRHHFGHQHNYFLWRPFL